MTTNTADKAKALFKAKSAEGILGYTTSPTIALESLINEFIAEVARVNLVRTAIHFKDGSIIMIKEGRWTFYALTQDTPA